MHQSFIKLKYFLEQNKSYPGCILPAKQTTTEKPQQSFKVIFIFSGEFSSSSSKEIKLCLAVSNESIVGGSVKLVH